MNRSSAKYILRILSACNAIDGRAVVLAPFSFNLRLMVLAAIAGAAVADATAAFAVIEDIYAPSDSRSQNIMNNSSA